MSQLYASLFYQAQVSAIFSDASLLGFMLEAEVALAEVQAELGLIPASAAASIAQVAAQGVNGLFDLDALAAAAALAGNIAIPMVKQLTAAVQRIDAEGARYVHWGATSQDIIDSATVLQCRSRAVSRSGDDWTQLAATSATDYTRL
jgi:3-carboxy-cis,cis-muconate cycloisomerase